MKGEEGELIARERTRQHMTVSRVCELSGIKPTRIELIEAGRVLASPDEVLNLAGALGIAPHDIRRSVL